MKLQIICRGSAVHGLGHLFRTRTFAKEVLGDNDVQVIAIVDKELESVFSELSSIVKYVRSEKDVSELVKVFNPEVVIFDLTYIKSEVFEEIKCCTKVTASISPIFNQIGKVNLLFTRSKLSKSVEDTVTYGGLKYSIFNEYCKKITTTEFKKNLEKPNLPIALSMGGADSPNKTLRVINAIQKLPDPITLWVALGEGYAHSYTELVKAIKQNKNHEIILAKANRSTWDILGNSVLAVLAGGLTTIEAVYAGLPSVNIFEKEEHLSATAQELFDLGVAANGHYFSDESLNVLVEKISHLYHNRNEIMEMRQNGVGVIDKKGSQRVIKVIEKHLQKAK